MKLERSTYSDPALKDKVTFSPPEVLGEREFFQDYSGKLAQLIVDRLPSNYRTRLGGAITEAGLPLALFDDIDDDAEVRRVFALIKKLVAESDPKKRVRMADEIACTVDGWGDSAPELDDIAD